MENLNNHQSNIKFTYTLSKNCVPFLDLDVQLSGVSIPLIYISSLQTDTNIYILRHLIQIIPSAPLYIVKHLE